MSQEQQRASAKESILVAASDLIRSQGVAGTSIADIVARSGTSAGAIYHHFGSKEQLVLAVGHAAAAGPLTMVMRTTPGLSPADLCVAALTRVAEDERTPKLLLQIWSGAQDDESLGRLVHERMELARATVRDFVAAWCEPNHPDADPDLIVELLLGLISGFAVQRALGFAVDFSAYRAFARDAVAGAIEGSVDTHT
ncbi:MAG: TetR/AcrR family transcriptional regulator [Arachnia sp.]